MRDGQVELVETLQMTDYVTVFQVSGTSTGLPFALVGLLLATIGAIIIAGKWHLHWHPPGWLFAIFVIVFGAFWILLNRQVLTWGSDALAALRAGQYSLAEGKVTDFHPMPYEGHDDECFTVGDQRFCYSDYVVTPGFHNTASHGGPIRAGVHVRIAYLGPTILRLQIRRDEVLTPAQSASRADAAQRQYATEIDNDQILQSLTTAFLFTGLCWVVWWNLQWRRAMRFWVRPPNRPATVYFFRVFFGLCLVSSLSELVQQLRRHPLTRQNIETVILTSVITCGIVGTVTAFFVWIAERRDGGTNRRRGAHGYRRRWWRRFANFTSFSICSRSCSGVSNFFSSRM